MTIRARDFLGDIEALVQDEGMPVAAACRRVASRIHVPFRSETLRKAYVRKRARARALQIPGCPPVPEVVSVETVAPAHVAHGSPGCPPARDVDEERPSGLPAASLMKAS